MSTPSSSSSDPVNVCATSANTSTTATAAAATTILPSLSALPRDALLSILSRLHPSDVERLEQAVPDVSIHTHDPVLWRHFYHTLISSRRTATAAMAPRPHLVVRGDGRLDWRGAFHEARRRESAISVARQQRLARFQQQQHRKQRAGDGESRTATNAGADNERRNDASPTTDVQQQQQQQQQQPTTTTPRRAGYRVERIGNVRRIIATDYHSSGAGSSRHHGNNNHPFIVWDAHLALNRFDWSNHPRGEQQRQDSTGNLPLRRKRATNPIQPSRTVYKRSDAGEGNDGDDGSDRSRHH